MNNICTIYNKFLYTIFHNHNQTKICPNKVVVSGYFSSLTYESESILLIK